MLSFCKQSSFPPIVDVVDVSLSSIKLFNFCWATLNSSDALVFLLFSVLSKSLLNSLSFDLFFFEEGVTNKLFYSVF